MDLSKVFPSLILTKCVAKGDGHPLRKGLGHGRRHPRPGERVKVISKMSSLFLHKVSTELKRALVVGLVLVVELPLLEVSCIALSSKIVKWQ